MHTQYARNTTLILFIMSAIVTARTVRAEKPALTADQAAALDRISAASLRGHLSFLASDLLEGRGTPSRGLDLAAEYIAAQFRRAGLEPAGDDGYFQTARWEVVAADPAAFTMTFHDDVKLLRIAVEHVSWPRPQAFNIDNVACIKVDWGADNAVANLNVDDVRGKVVLVAIPDSHSARLPEQRTRTRAANAFLAQLREKRPALVVNVRKDPKAATGLGTGRLVDPESPSSGGFQPGAIDSPLITVHDPRLAALFDKMPVGPVSARVSLQVPEPSKRPATLRNVIGLLPGSDPALKSTYVMVTAHYDHLGFGPAVDGDRIYNGANDDGSGTVSVVELATALATLKQRPRRSLVFLAFFGEEHGMLGSRYYARHPVFPIAETVADLNLEQVGRTDSSEGPQVATASVTGIDFSDVGSIVQAAGETEGVRVYKHPLNSDRFFGASDNDSLAQLGVPAHSVSVAYIYPDYHGALDHWEKIDYANTARITRMIGRAMLAIANSTTIPRWNESNPKAERYLRAWRSRHDGEKAP